MKIATIFCLLLLGCGLASAIDNVPPWVTDEEAAELRDEPKSFAGNTFDSSEVSYPEDRAVQLFGTFTFVHEQVGQVGQIMFHYGSPPQVIAVPYVKQEHSEAATQLGSKIIRALEAALREKERGVSE